MIEWSENKVEENGPPGRFSIDPKKILKRQSIILFLFLFIFLGGDFLTGFQKSMIEWSENKVEENEVGFYKFKINILFVRICFGWFLVHPMISVLAILAVLAILVNIFFNFFAFFASWGHSIGGPSKETFLFGLSIMEKTRGTNRQINK